MANPILALPKDSRFATDSLGISKSYEAFLQSLYYALGDSKGSVQFNEDSIQPKVEGTDLNVTTTGDILFNDVAWPTSDGSVNDAIAGTSDTQLEMVSLSVLGVGDSTGDVKLTFKTTADPGWVLLNDGTIGSATSGASTRANADTEDLFILLWDNVSNTYAPVSSGRGVSAQADFDANKTITLPRSLGRSFSVSGAGSGLTSRALGSYNGEETHEVTISEFPSHSHSYNLYRFGGATATENSVYTNDFQGGTSKNVPTGNPIISGTSDEFDAVEGHENMQPTSFVRSMIKL